jgi:transposase
MIWATIWGAGHSGITYLEGDYESEKQGYTARSYIRVLEANLYSIWEPGLEFMQDNASIHKAGLVCKWFRDHGIPLTEWPPYSPDLDPMKMPGQSSKRRYIS